MALFFLSIPPVHFANTASFLPAFLRSPIAAQLRVAPMPPTHVIAWRWTEGPINRATTFNTIRPLQFTRTAAAELCRRRCRSRECSRVAGQSIERAAAPENRVVLNTTHSLVRFEWGLLGSPPSFASPLKLQISVTSNFRARK